MKIVRIIIGVIVFSTLVLVFIIANYGGFKKITVNTRLEGGEKIVFKKMKGSYDKTAEFSRILELELNKVNIKSNQSIGIYYDNPRFVKKDSLHSDIGWIIQHSDTNKLISKFNYKTIPVKNYITAEFPLKGSLSIMVGVLKVYPAISKYIRDNGYSEKGAVMEIYDVDNHKIFYRKELLKK